LYQAPRGTIDILPEDEAYWRYVREKVEKVASLYGYRQIETPAFEDASLFRRSVGAGTDIVEKEMYIFKDLGGNELALRPEGTAPVCRAYLEYGMASLPQPVKLFYVVPVFRYERPQAGRLREHHQFGFEAIGEGDATLDAEVIAMAWRFYLMTGLTGLTLQINSIGCRACRPAYIGTLKDYYQNHLAGLCEDCRTRLERNPLRLLDCKQASCQAFAGAAPKSYEHLCPECAAHFADLKRYLGVLEIPFVINSRLVRGLDYYTRTVFEIQPLIEGGQSTIGGGGRYDNLIGELGGKPTPAIGFATGIERVILNLKRQNLAIPGLPGPSIFVANIGPGTKDVAFALTARLQAAGLGVLQAMGEASLRAQLRKANSLGVRFALIIGDDELKNGTVMLRDMAGASQEVMPLADVARLLQNKLR
jgi:histidyl-tRNA synthetase